jgi:hypothetical protein
MPIYNNIKCIYVHIPKTGGQSISKMLSQAELLCKNENNCELEHLTMSMILNRLKPESYFKFAIVRHPVDRLVSEYFFSKKYRPYLLNTEHYTFHNTLKQFQK